MGFADMTWQAIEKVPAKRARRPAPPPTIRLYRNARAASVVVTASRSVVDALHLTAGESTIAVLLNHRAIAIRPADPTEKAARKLARNRTASVRELGNLLAPGESWSVEVEVDTEAGAAWGVLPDELVTRLRGGAA